MLTALNQMSRDAYFKSIDDAMLKRNLNTVGTRVTQSKPVESFALAAAPTAKNLKNEATMRATMGSWRSGNTFFQNQVFGVHDNHIGDMTQYSVTGNPAGKNTRLHTTQTTLLKQEQTREK